MVQHRKITKSRGSERYRRRCIPLQNDAPSHPEDDELPDGIPRSLQSQRQLQNRKTSTQRICKERDVGVRIENPARAAWFACTFQDGFTCGLDGNRCHQHNQCHHKHARTHSEEGCLILINDRGRHSRPGRNKPQKKIINGFQLQACRP